MAGELIIDDFEKSVGTFKKQQDSLEGLRLGGASDDAIAIAGGIVLETLQEVTDEFNENPKIGEYYKGLLDSTGRNAELQRELSGFVDSTPDLLDRIAALAPRADYDELEYALGVFAAFGGDEAATFVSDTRAYEDSAPQARRSASKKPQAEALTSGESELATSIRTRLIDNMTQLRHKYAGKKLVFEGSGLEKRVEMVIGELPDGKWQGRGNGIPFKTTQHRAEALFALLEHGADGEPMVPQDFADVGLAADAVSISNEGAIKPSGNKQWSNIRGQTLNSLLEYRYMGVVKRADGSGHAKLWSVVAFQGLENEEGRLSAVENVLVPVVKTAQEGGLGGTALAAAGGVVTLEQPKDANPQDTEPAVVLDEEIATKDGQPFGIIETVEPQGTEAPSTLGVTVVSETRTPGGALLDLTIGQLPSIEGVSIVGTSSSEQLDSAEGDLGLEDLREKLIDLRIELRDEEVALIQKLLETTGPVDIVELAGSLKGIKGPMISRGDMQEWSGIINDLIEKYPDLLISEVVDDVDRFIGLSPKLLEALGLSVDEADELSETDDVPEKIQEDIEPTPEPIEIDLKAEAVLSKTVDTTTSILALNAGGLEIEVEGGNLRVLADFIVQQGEMVLGRKMLKDVFTRWVVESALGEGPESLIAKRILVKQVNKTTKEISYRVAKQFVPVFSQLGDDYAGRVMEDMEKAGEVYIKNASNELPDNVVFGGGDGAPELKYMNADNEQVKVKLTEHMLAALINLEPGEFYGVNDVINLAQSQNQIKNPGKIRKRNAQIRSIMKHLVDSGVAARGVVDDSSVRLSVNPFFGSGMNQEDSQ